MDKLRALSGSEIVDVEAVLGDSGGADTIGLGTNGERTVRPDSDQMPMISLG